MPSPPTRRTAGSERVVELLAPFRGMWVAIERPWRRVLAAHRDRRECLRLAAASAPLEELLPLLYRVPAAAAMVCTQER